MRHLLMLESKSRWQSQRNGFLRASRFVEVTGPAELWRSFQEPGCGLGDFLGRAAEAGLSRTLIAAQVAQLKRFGMLEELLLDGQGLPLLARQISERFAPTLPVEGESYRFSRFSLLLGMELLYFDMTPSDVNVAVARVIIPG